MKSKLLFVTGWFAAIVALCLLPAPVQAGSIFIFGGNSADAYFSAVDPDNTCIITDAIVIAGTGTQQGPMPLRSEARAGIWISKYDACDDVPLLAGFGYAALDSGAFTVSESLDSAFLDTTITVYDVVSRSMSDVKVTLVWTGKGDLNQGKSSSQFQSGKCTFSRRWSGTWRLAEASGRIFPTSDAAINYAPSPSVSATIQAAKNGAIAISCK